jgi:hypothetical protein
MCARIRILSPTPSFFIKTINKTETKPPTAIATCQFQLLWKGSEQNSFPSNMQRPRSRSIHSHPQSTQAHSFIYFSIVFFKFTLHRCPIFKPSIILKKIWVKVLNERNENPIHQLKLQQRIHSQYFID